MRDSREDPGTRQNHGHPVSWARHCWAKPAVAPRASLPEFEIPLQELVKRLAVPEQRGQRQVDDSSFAWQIAVIDQPSKWPDGKHVNGKQPNGDSDASRCPAAFAVVFLVVSVVRRTIPRLRFGLIWQARCLPHVSGLWYARREPQAPAIATRFSGLIG